MVLCDGQVGIPALHCQAVLMDTRAERSAPRPLGRSTSAGPATPKTPSSTSLSTPSEAPTPLSPRPNRPPAPTPSIPKISSPRRPVPLAARAQPMPPTHPLPPALPMADSLRVAPPPDPRTAPMSLRTATTRHPAALLVAALLRVSWWAL